MKKLISFVMVVLMLTGCAAQTFRDAREKANLVKNGMTVAQATEVLGMPPTHVTSSVAQWRRGNAQAYLGNKLGAIELKLNNGRIFDIPEGGIFSPAGLEQVRLKWLARQAEEQERLKIVEAEEAEKERLAALAYEKKALADKEAQEKAKALRLKEIAEEIDAAGKSIVVCKDKISCNKVFALAQIYVQQNADQKIQVATDTIIETYNPTEDGKVAITVTKMPRAGTVEVVKITPSCKNEKGYAEELCRAKRTNIYRGFKPFIELSLSR